MATGSAPTIQNPVEEKSALFRFGISISDSGMPTTWKVKIPPAGITRSSIHLTTTGINACSRTRNSIWNTGIVFGNSDGASSPPRK
jgi:hypothetical protein